MDEDYIVTLSPGDFRPYKKVILDAKNRELVEDCNDLLLKKLQIQKIFFSGFENYKVGYRSNLKNCQNRATLFHHVLHSLHIKSLSCFAMIYFRNSFDEFYLTFVKIRQISHKRT